MRKFTLKSLYKPISAAMLFLASTGAYAQYCIPTSDYGCSDGDYLNSFILNGENNTAINDLNTDYVCFLKSITGFKIRVFMAYFSPWIHGFLL